MARKWLKLYYVNLYCVHKFINEVNCIPPNAKGIPRNTCRISSDFLFCLTYVAVAKKDVF